MKHCVLGFVGRKTHTLHVYTHVHVFLVFFFIETLNRLTLFASLLSLLWFAVDTMVSLIVRYGQSYLITGRWKYVGRFNFVEINVNLLVGLKVL